MCQGPLKILFEDDEYVAVYKPSGLMVHHNRHNRNGPAALQLVRDMIGDFVFPVQRLDRATSGILLFAKSSSGAAAIAEEFRARRVHKSYLAVVRGHMPAEQTIDHPIGEKPDGSKIPAITHCTTLRKTELPFPCGPYATARYSLVQAVPETGRFHQIRKHLKHIAHPIIGDTCHGDGDHNRLFREKFGIYRLLLQAESLAFRQPFSGESIRIVIPPDDELLAAFENRVLPVP